MTSQYIYLLQEREFIKTNEAIYKVGMTVQENLKRFASYPKGSVLLFQMICSDCKVAERDIIKKFKEQFTLRDDIGSEYFHGDYNAMIDVIYKVIKSGCAVEELDEQCDACNGSGTAYLSDDIYATCMECCCTNCNKKNALCICNDEEPEPDDYIITTYEEYIKFSDINKIIITNKKKQTGYLKFDGNGLWRQMYDEKSENFIKDDLESLELFITHNPPCCRKMIEPESKLISERDIWDLPKYKHKKTGDLISSDVYKSFSVEECFNYDKIKYKYVDVTYGAEAVCKDIIKKCYVKKKPIIYKPEYHEYVVNVYESYGDPYTQSSYCVFDALNNKFITKFFNDNIYMSDLRCTSFTPFHINADNIHFVDKILSLLITPELKTQYKKLAHSLIIKEEIVVFYDGNNCTLTHWITELLRKLSYGKTTYNRYHILDSNSVLSIEYVKKIIKKEKAKIIIVNTDKLIYNIDKCMIYIKTDTELLAYLKTKNSKHQLDKIDDQLYLDRLFTDGDLLLTEFLRWCCQ